MRKRRGQEAAWLRQALLALVQRGRATEGPETPGEAFHYRRLTVHSDFMGAPLERTQIRFMWPVPGHSHRPPLVWWFPATHFRDLVR